MKLSEMLNPPQPCEAKGLPLTDKRKGFMWFCKLAGRNFAKGRSKPECYCALALSGCRKSLQEVSK